jgi:hypothetical protein
VSTTVCKATFQDIPSPAAPTFTDVGPGPPPDSFETR